MLAKVKKRHISGQCRDDKNWVFKHKIGLSNLVFIKYAFSNCSFGMSVLDFQICTYREEKQIVATARGSPHSRGFRQVRFVLPPWQAARRRPLPGCIRAQMCQKRVFYCLLKIIVDLQCGTSFCGTAWWPRHTYAYPSFFSILYHVLSREVGWRSLRCAVLRIRTWCEFRNQRVFHQHCLLEQKDTARTLQKHPKPSRVTVSFNFHSFIMIISYDK